MKKLILIVSVLAFLAASCRVFKDNDIYVDHSKEKDQFKVNNKANKHSKNCKNTFK
jgi:hypothetical protein